MNISLLKVFLFGSPRLERDGQPLEVTLRKGLALFAYLAGTRQSYTRDALAALFWPENDQRTARANLRRALYRLKQELGDNVLRIESENVGWDPTADIWLDTHEYRGHISGCLPLPDSETILSGDCEERLKRAAALYKDGFMAGFTLSDCPAFDDWQFFQQEELRQGQARVLEKLTDVHQAKSDWELAIDHVRRWLALDPLHEPAHRRLMQLYAQSGQWAAALRQFEECRRILDKEFGLPPEEETIALHETIKSRRSMPAKDAKPTIIPETHYVRSGDVYIAYQVLGNGPVDILFVNGFVNHIEHGWKESRLARFYRRLADFSRLILFDKRGVGLSERVGYPPTLEHTMDDMLAVMDAVKSKKPFLMGVSEGGPNTALFAAAYPKRTTGLILYGTVARFLRNTDYPWAPTREQWQRWLEKLVNDWGGPVSLGRFAPSLANDEAFRRWWAQMLRLASSPRGVESILKIASEIDISNILPSIHVPTLVLHRSGDQVMRVGGGRYLARSIPNAHYVELPGNDHWWWVGDTEALLNEIEGFLQTTDIG